KVVILGAGGAAKAIAAILALHGTAHLTVANRDRSRAENLVKELKDKLVADRAFTCELAAVGLTDRELDHALANGRLVVQTTPVGMYPRIEAEPVIDPGRLSPRNLVYDIIFNPRQTRFLAEANKRGCKTANGMGMLLHQGALAFELWTKEQAPLTVMRDALAAAQ
ncbi:MAG TPA: saccharopine dehydrogenase NADP-binding domain-containing protein, partial [Desulfobacteria bacterium]|nr:saccharopine dehydrogenase NADP-binding domain-containing protein [Desulfobacteria bacterium]